MTLHRFREISSHPFQSIRKEKADHRKVIGYLLPDFPEEIVHAAGAVPFLLSGGSLDAGRADSRLQTYACPICRRSLAWALKGELDFLDGMVIPIVCDTTRCLAHIWKKNCKMPFFERLLVPRIRNGSSVGGYLLRELSRFKKRLEDFLGVEISDESLSRSLSIYSENRKMLATLYGLREENPLRFSNADFYDVVRSSYIVPKEVHNLWLKELLQEVENDPRETQEARGPMRIFLWGKLAEPRDLFVYLDELGCHVVSDNLWDGFSYASSRLPERKEPLEELAHVSLSRAPLPVHLDPLRKRQQSLLEKVRARSLDGVLFILPKHCEPMAFESPAIQASLKDLGIPSLFIEMESDHSFLTQLRRRLEIFVEVVKTKTFD